jgi:hypothetical protein
LIYNLLPKSKDIATFFSHVVNVTGKIEILEKERKDVIDRIKGPFNLLPPQVP